MDVRDHRYPSPIKNSKKLVELYKDLSTLQSENEMQSQTVEDSLDKLAKDPCQVIKLNLAFSIVAADKFQLKTGMTKQLVMVAFYATELEKNPEIARFHLQVKKKMQNVLYGLGD